MRKVIAYCAGARVGALKMYKIFQKRSKQKMLKIAYIVGFSVGDLVGILFFQIQKILCHRFLLKRQTYNDGAVVGISVGALSKQKTNNFAVSQNILGRFRCWSFCPSTILYQKKGNFCAWICFVLKTAYSVGVIVGLGVSNIPPKEQINGSSKSQLL